MKTMLIRCIFLWFIIWSISVNLSFSNVSADDININQLSDEQMKTIDSLIVNEMKRNRAPGVVISIVKENKTIYQKSYGYADLKRKIPVTSDTLFEIGSNTKAFTALALLQLVDQGLINIADPVSKYIPWFKMKYSGQYVDISIEQLLQHTSGIAFESIGNIPISSSDDALEITVRGLVNKELKFLPGKQFEYATINYNIIGYLIQIVSKEKYEKYMKKNILAPLHLENTFLFRDEAEKHQMAKGYKFGFNFPIQYDSPIYRGSAPSANFISNIKDMDQWLKIQMNNDETEPLYKLIKESQKTQLDYSSNVQYTMGWKIARNGELLFHSGSSPTYSSFVAIHPKEQMGIVVLSNTISTFTDLLGQKMDAIVHSQDNDEVLPDDYYIGLDKKYSLISYVVAPMMLALLFLVFLQILRIKKKRKSFIGFNSEFYVSTTFLVINILAVSTFYYFLPYILFKKLPWNFVIVWSPYSIFVALIFIYSVCLLSAFYFWMSHVYKKSHLIA